MTSLSLKIVLDEGAVTRTLMFNAATKVRDAHGIVRDKILTLDPNKEYGFFLTSVENESAGFWLQENKTLEYYMLRDGDSLFYLPKLRNLKVRMLDGAVKTLQVDESQKIEDLMVVICEKIGTANHEEYGLCREETQAIEETTKAPTGTLTLKRKSREKDAQLEQMSKKLKTDDNVEWLDQRKTLRELRVEPKDTLLFKRRLFYSDRNIGSRDPVQLNLLYVQARDAILDGRQVVTEEKAIEFAGIQCMVQYGDFQEKKHKPGFIENLKEFLPEQYANSWGVEKKVIQMHQKLSNLSSENPMHLYIMTARKLPTYGVTFFLVKEQQKGKKKLVPRLLGINSESILRLDEGTKEILQTWPLTQVKSYTAGKESFTLNFGDYSDKSYVVKTNEAIRIKDILEGYIDIIRKKQSAPFNYTPVEGEAICEDMVESSKGTVVQTMVPSKVVEHSLVGPSQIISVDQGHMSQQGTQIVTVQQIITSVRGDRSQQPTKGEISRRSSIPQDFGKRLNHLNSECVKTVVLLSNPTAENLQQVRKIVDDLEDGMPGIEKGVKEVAGSLHGDASQKLLEDLDELCNYMNTLATTTRRSDLRNPDRLMEAQDAARKVAEISTQMCFSLDPKTKRRSTLLMRSRNSFIQDEKTEASLRRASFITAADNASQAVEEAHEDLDQRYNGPILSDEELRRLENKAADRMGKLNAAIALLLNAHADPRNIDYEMAVNSMKTIQDIMPEFVQDAKPLTGVGDSSSGRALREQIGHLLNRTGTICKLTGSHDIHAMQFEGDEYANVANKLIYTFSRAYCKPSGKPIPDEENKITSQCKDIEEKANLLLLVTNELTSLEQNDPRTSDVEAAEVKCSDAVRGLLACVKLTAPSIHEPHCQSALTAAVENLSSSAQNLILCSKPLLEKPNRHNIAHQLADGSFNLARALDKLKEMYANINGPKTEQMDISEAPNTQEANRLKFIATAASTKNAIMDAESELQQIMKTPTPLVTKPTKRDPVVQRLLSQKLAQLNAAVAALLKATSDQDNPNYDTAEMAANTIRELAPDIIKNTKLMQGTMNENSWNETISTLEDMLEATHGVCLNAENSNIQEMNNAASRFANSSGKLVYVFNPRKNPRKEKEIIDLSRTALRDTSQMLSNVYVLAEAVGGKDGDDLDSAGVNVVDAAQLLLRTAEITAPSIADARCQATLLSSVDSLSDLTRMLESTWKPLVQSSDYCQIVDDLNRDLNLVQIGLNKLRRACHDNTDEEDIMNGETDENKQQEIKRLKFIATKTAAKNALLDANKQFDEIIKKPKAKKSNDDVKNRNLEVERRISEKLAQLNAAIAKFLQANSDKENPDYEVAEAAFNDICKLTPDIIKDSEHLYGNVNDESWKEIAEHLKAILDATQGMCSISQEDDVKEMNDAATKFAKSSGKLIYIFNPRKNPKKEEQISDLSRSAVEQTSQMFSRVHQLAGSVGGEEGNKLDEAGVKVVDTAHQLLKTAEITAPSISDARCRETILSAIQRHSGNLKDLENTWMPYIDEHRGTGNRLNNDLKSVKMVLDRLRDACLDCTENDDTTAREIGGNENQERKKLKFIATKSAAKKALSEADKQLDEIMIKPVSKKSNDDISRTNPEVERRISGKLAELNAAVATLVQTSTDNNIPDYENAEMAINNICKLTPDIIKDTKHLHGNMDDKSWKEVADNLKAILDATQGMCSNSHEGDVQEINEAASKFAESSGKLIYIFNPRKNPKKEEQISDLSRSAAEQTSQMLSSVYQLAESVGGEEGNKLDEAGVKVVDVAKQLLKTAEITAPSISDACCKETLLSAIQRLSGHLKDLENTWMPLVNDPNHREIGNQLHHNLKSVEMVLNNLKDACLDKAGNDELPVSEIRQDEMQERKRLQFIATKSAAIKSLTKADKQLEEIVKKPITKEIKDQNKSPDVKRNLSEKLAGLNAAIATLLLASCDRDNPDYDSAEIAINNICKLTEDIIKDTDHLHGCTDDKTLKETIGHLKAMLDATRGICLNCREDDFKEMNDAASTFSKSSGKLIYIFNPRVDPKKEEQISLLSRSAVEQTSRMLSHVYQLTESVGDEDGHKLDDVGVKVVDFAQQLLKTAEVTAPSIADTRCKTALLEAINRLSDQLRAMENTWKPITKRPEHHQTCDKLNKDLNLIQIALDKLKDACHDDNGTDTIKHPETQRLLYIATALKAKKAMQAAEKELNDKTPVKAIEKSEVPAMKRSLSHRLARLNSCIASLVLATADDEKPDYNAATRSIDTISNLTPDIIRDVKSIKGDIDKKSWKIVDENLNDVVVITRNICRHVEDNNPQELKEEAFRCAKSVGRLSYVFGPAPDATKENQILDLSRSAAEQTSLMLSDVQQLADKIGGDVAKKLNSYQVQVARASKILQKTAEILAPTISDAYCQETLISCVDDLSKLSEELKRTWKPIVQAPQLRQNGEKLEENLKHVHTTLNKLRNACQKTDDSEATTAPTHINVQHAKEKIKEIEKLFLEDKALELPANEHLDKPGTTIKPITEQREQISHNIGSLNEAMARLLQAMLDLKNPDNVRRVEKSIDIMSKLTPDIVKETIALQRNVDDDSRKILFEEAKSLCTASQAICDSVERGNMEELNSAASQYAQTSRKLRYIISPRTYPNKEKKILDMSRSACERTSLMLSRVSRMAHHIEREKRIELDTSGAKVANAAQVLLNNAQITASSINEKNCQSALTSTVDTLTEHTQDLKDIWVPLAQQTEHKEIGEQLRRDLRLLLTELDKLKTTCQDDTEDVPMVVQHQANPNVKQKQPDINNIDNILEDIQKNVKEGKTVQQNKVTERLIIEDTPLRSLASKILDSVMTKLAVGKTKSKDVSSKEHNELIAFSKELQAAIKSLDITNAKCRNDPLDPKKRQELENAIINLQQICLLSRRKNGEQNNIIDLADYIGDVTESVDTISNVVDGIKREHGSEALMNIKNACERIKDNARKVLNLEDEQLADGNIIDDMLKIDQFATDCEKEVKHMNLAVPKINDEKARQKLNDKLQSLACCCDLLRFATKSSISSAKSATLDEGLQNLEDIEKKIEIILKTTEGDKVGSGGAISKPALQAAQTALATAVAAGNETELPKALTKYAVQMRGIGVHHQKFRLKDHLKKLLDLLKTHAVITCRRVATWQEDKASETTATIDNILEELKSFAEEVEKSQNPSQKGSSSPVQIIRDSDIKNLLTPSESTVTGDRTQLNNKLQQQIQKLNSISGTIALSLHKPESLSRSLHTTSEAAQQLAAIARGIKSEDPVQHKRIEEAVQEMSIATYNLLKTSESSSHSKNPIDSRRRLLEACRLLNVAINKLGRAAFPADKLRNECSEMNRNLQLQQTFLQANTPTCALSYTDCLDALNNQNDVIHKLRSEDPIPRTDITTSLRYVTSSVCNSAEFAAQSAYLLSLSDADQSVAKHGVVDLARLYKVTEATEDTCLQIICAGPGEQAAELNGCLIKQVQQLQEAVDDATDKVKGDIKHPLIANSRELKSALNSLHGGIHLPTCKEADFTLKIMKHLDTIKKINVIIKMVPQPELDKGPKKTRMSTEVIDHTKSLLASTSLMVKKASSSEEKVVTWTMFSSGEVIKAFEALITCIREKGAEAGFIESLKSQEDQDAPPKSFVQKQVDLVNCWLQKPASKEKDKAAGVKAAEHVTSLAEQMCEDLTGTEREEMKHMIAETKQLLSDCTSKYNSDKAYLLLERLKELRKMLEKGVVTRVVEDFLVEIPLDNLDTLQTETDARKRKFLLERKIAELLAQLGRVTKTARLVGSTGTAPKHELASTTDQVELLAPALVKAAQDTIHSPNDKNSIKHYEDLLQQYAQSLAKVRDLCDQAVDPIDFAQAAGETMHRIKEDSTVHSNDPQKSIYTSKVILKLGNRVVKAGMKSSLVQHDPELKETLAKIDQTVTAKYEDVKKADWSEVMAEIMKKTSEVESALGGENIFLKQADNNQPIFAAAMDLHAAVREWSARDNEIVAVAKRMAVLMARLSDYMNTENKRELLHTSKSIVSESREVAALAKKLALECTDMRIRTNLLQVCERIPTISGQLKMLTTVKGSSFGQGSKEDKEAMTMLVGNAQNLMTSIQEVVKAAASASVKIMSQRGSRMKWVRRNFY